MILFSFSMISTSRLSSPKNYWNSIQSQVSPAVFDSSIQVNPNNQIFYWIDATSPPSCDTNTCSQTGIHSEMFSWKVLAQFPPLQPHCGFSARKHRLTSKWRCRRAQLPGGSEPTAYVDVGRNYTLIRIRVKTLIALAALHRSAAPVCTGNIFHRISCRTNRTCFIFKRIPCHIFIVISVFRSSLSSL